LHLIRYHPLPIPSMPRSQQLLIRGGATTKW
jgi:hypothetical protein